MEKPPPSSPPDSPTDDKAFRLIASVSTALGLGTAFGALACLQWRPDGSLDFRWHPMVLLWVAVGIACAFLFWNAIWRAEARDRGSKIRTVGSYFLLVAATLADVAYSLRTYPQDKISQFYLGLAGAVVALSVAGWLISFVIRGFARFDAADPIAKHDRDGN
jgi:hypothetical protein